MWCSWTPLYRRLRERRFPPCVLSIRLMKLVTTLLGDYLGGDTAFARRLSRSPFYAGDDPTAYRWHCQHHRVDHLSHLRDEVRTMTGQTTPQPNTRPQQNFSSGPELIEAVKKPPRTSYPSPRAPCVPRKRFTQRRSLRRRSNRRGKGFMDHRGARCARRDSFPARSS